MEDPNISPDTRCLMQVDLINAFNRVDRATAFREVRRLFPELARWFESTYGTQAELLFGEAVIKSCDGFHQGDPLACLFFAVVLHPIILKISSEVPGLLLNGWFLDDGSLVGKLEDLSAAANIIIPLKDFFSPPWPLLPIPNLPSGVQVFLLLTWILSTRAYQG